MISSRSPARAQALALLATLVLAVPQVAAESSQGELVAREPTPQRGRPWQYSSFAADNDLACCPEGTEKDTGSCCAEGLVCDATNSTGHGPTCISVPTSTNGTTNHTSNHTTTTGPSPSETDSGASSVAAWGMWTSVLGLAAAVGIMSF